VHTWHGLSASLLGLSILTAEADRCRHAHSAHGLSSPGRPSAGACYRACVLGGVLADRAGPEHDHVVGVFRGVFRGGFCRVR
jgi:hypothetical protein